MRPSLALPARGRDSDSAAVRDSRSGAQTLSYFTMGILLRSMVTATARISTTLTHFGRGVPVRVLLWMRARSGMNMNANFIKIFKKNAQMYVYVFESAAADLPHRRFGGLLLLPCHIETLPWDWKPHEVSLRLGHPEVRVLLTGNTIIFKQRKC